MASEQKGKYQPWSHEEFMADINVRCMTPTALKTYMMLLHEAFVGKTRPDLPDNERDLEKMAYCNSHKEWLSVKDVVLEMFDRDLVGGIPVLFQKRLRKDWEKENMGVVYFIQGEKTGRIKIGYTTKPIRIRMSQLQVGSPDKLKLLGTMQGGAVAEGAIQGQWASLHSHGEWFNQSPELLSYIREVAECPSE